ncbi:MAG: response regulator [Treponema sp.]|nr:response regulator [Treponema sp.]
MQNHDNDSGLLSSSRFLSTTLHEIRTPIQTIIASVELLNETKLDNEQKEYLRQISFSADALLNLANNILDYTKISSKEFHLENAAFDIIRLVESVTDLVSIEAFNKKIEIITDNDMTIAHKIMGDQVRVQQVLLNLIKNAVKFTSKGYIKISTRLKEDKILIKICDTGIGLNDESKAKIFNAFYQADSSTTRKFGGTGLGLTISKSLVEAMGGTIGVSDNPSGGSIFWFTLPYNPQPQSKPEKLELVIPNNTRILIIDDSMTAASAFSKTLRFMGITEIETANDSETGLQMMHEFAKAGKPFSIVFIDMLMTTISGWHIASKINDDKEINNAKLYLMVPEGQMGSDAKMKILNWFDGYLYKPLKHKKVYELLALCFKEYFEQAVIDSKDPQLIRHLKHVAATEKEQAVSAINKITTSIIQENKEHNLTHGMKVLIAEDHVVNRKLIVTFLTRFGAEVIEAQDGQQAVEMYQANPNIEYIFMDIQMPIMNGIEASKEIRKLGYKGIIIACTANNDTADFITYTQAGMNDVLVKPFKSSMIKEILEKWSSALILPTAKELTDLLKSTESQEKTWNEEDFMDTIANDVSFGKQLIKDFTEQTDSLINAIPELIAANNYSELRRTGHTLKGSASTVSAFKLSDYAARLNQAAKAQDIQALEINYNNLKKELVNFKKQTSSWKNQNDL